jgi:uncharacterized protein YraI
MNEPVFPFSALVRAPRLRRLIALFAAVALVLMTVPLALAFAQNDTGVTAEAVGEANLRANTDVASDALGQIRAGTRYPVVGRSEFFPWLLLGDPATGQPIGWVFADLVTVQGDRSRVPFSSIVVGAGGAGPAVLTAVPTPTQAAAAEGTAAVAQGSGTAPADAPESGVIGVVLGEINVRYGPGVDYARLGVGRAGDRYTILGWHTGLPWVRIAYAASPTGEAWVAQDLITIEGDLFSLPSTSATSFTLPTLTPTPSAAQESRGLAAIGVTPPPNSPAFQALGDRIWGSMLEAGFDPATSRLGAFFLMNLSTGETVSYGDDIAFSGMSVNKIAILAAYFASIDAPPEEADAFMLAEAMVCSENISTNEMLAAIGEGNPYTGANRVTDLLTALGLERTFIYTPFANDPFITPQAPLTRTTDADQALAQPDPYNQMTVSEMGALLYGLYTCAAGSPASPLFTRLPEGTFTQSECRRALHLMTFNRIGALIEVGVPATVPLAHKHGWIDDTHGDAAIVFSPGGDYLFVMVLHGPTWLDFALSSQVIQEASRTVYNAFNPLEPLDAVRVDTGVGDVAACNASLLSSPVVTDMMNGSF